jgi:hypothetical protein
MPASPPGLVTRELEAAFEARADTCLLVNCGNVRPHVFLLDLIAGIWKRRSPDERDPCRDFAQRYFASAAPAAEDCYRRYFQSALRLGRHEDQRAGEEFYHHTARRLVNHWLRGSAGDSCVPLQWATGEIAFEDQVAWVQRACESGLTGWESLSRSCEDAEPRLRRRAERDFFRDNLRLPVTLHLSGCRGLISLCESFQAFRRGDLPKAFVRASRAVGDFQEGAQALRHAEHGKWKNFYRADWLTNVASTLYALEALRGYLRARGDGPDFFQWYKEFLMPESEKGIYLENTHRRPLPDDELAQRLEHELPAAKE